MLLHPLSFTLHFAYVKIAYVNLPLCDEPAIVFHKERFQLPLASQFWKWWKIKIWFQVHSKKREKIDKYLWKFSRPIHWKQLPLVAQIMPNYALSMTIFPLCWHVLFLFAGPGGGGPSSTGKGYSNCDERHQSFYQNKVNPLWVSEAIWRYKSISTLPQVMACYLTAPNHYQNQFRLIIKCVSWHSHESDFTSAKKNHPSIEFENYLMKITGTSSRGQCVKRACPIFGHAWTTMGHSPVSV